jgi:hypothetical protein
MRPIIGVTSKGIHMAKPSKEGLIAGTVAIVAVAGLGAAVKAQGDRDAKKSTPSPAPSATAKR